MPKIKNRKIISRTNLFRVDQLDINFDHSRKRLIDRRDQILDNPISTQQFVFVLDEFELVGIQVRGQLLKIQR